MKEDLTKKMIGLSGKGWMIFSTYAPSLALSSIFDRVAYAFYFINVEPGLALGIPMVIGFISPDGSGLQRVLMGLWLGAAILFFILFFPIHPSPGL
jgi:hypothetical protein